MQPAVHIKKTIDFNKNFRALLEVLKLVAVSEYHSLERKLKTFERLQEVLGEFFSCIDVEGIDHPFTNPRGKPPIIVAVTSDAGLLGGVNNQVVSRAMELMRETGGSLVIVGERGMPYAQDAGVPFKYFPGVVDARRFEQACDLRDALVEMLVSGKNGGLRIVYPRAHSFVVHRVEVATLLPFKQPVPLDDDAPKRAPAPGGKGDEFIMESDPASVAEYLIFIVIAQRIYEIFGQARVCEQAARYLHLEESCNKILEMNKKLLLIYFKRRHEVIDANMRELFSARIGVHDD